MTNRLLSKGLNRVLVAIMMCTPALAITITISEQTVTLDSSGNPIPQTLPFRVVNTGWIVLCENFIGGQCDQAGASDTIFLSNPVLTGFTTFVFCSDVASISTDGGDGCDTSGNHFPPTGAPVNYLPEIVTEGGIEITPYTPGSGDVGYAVVAGVPVTYNLVSDTPEPASASLFISGSILLGWLAIRRCKFRLPRSPFA